MADRFQQADELRKEIAGLDHRILELVEQRAGLSKKIQRTLEGEPVPEVSEQEWLESVLADASGEMPRESLSAIFREVRAAGRSLELPVRVAMVGFSGGFCHQAVLEEYGATAPTLECGSVAEALAEVIRGRAAVACFPIESSADGLSQSALLTLAETDLVLVGERYTHAIYDLVGLSSDVGALEKVYMTPVGHAACQRFLDQELPRASLFDVRSAVEATDLAREAPTNAALVPRRCGRAAKLSLLRENVGDVADLKLRHGMAAARPAMRSGNDVSCLLFSTDDTPGALYEVLRHLAERGINLRKLHSLPVRRDGIDYLFYVEVSGHASDRSVVTVLEAVKRNARYLKLLGSFPAAS